MQGAAYPAGGCTDSGAGTPRAELLAPARGIAARPTLSTDVTSGVIVKLRVLTKCFLQSISLRFIPISISCVMYSNANLMPLHLAAQGASYCAQFVVAVVLPKLAHAAMCKARCFG